MEVLDDIERFSQLALAAAYFAGIIVAIVFWSRHPRQSFWLLIAAVLMLGVELIYIGTWFLSGDFIDDADFYAVLGTFAAVVRIVAFALLVAAVLSGRARRRPSFMDLDDDPP